MHDDMKRFEPPPDVSDVKDDFLRAHKMATEREDGSVGFDSDRLLWAVLSVLHERIEKKLKAK